MMQEGYLFKGNQLYIPKCSMRDKLLKEKCWVCVIFFACVCVWVRQIRRLRLTIPSPRALLCAPGAFLGGSQGGAGMPPPWLCGAFGATPRFFFFWAVFAIFSGFCYF
jgi:hypothetical protein